MSDNDHEYSQFVDAVNVEHDDLLWDHLIVQPIARPQYGDSNPYVNATHDEGEETKEEDAHGGHEQETYSGSMLFGTIEVDLETDTVTTPALEVVISHNTTAPSGGPDEETPNAPDSRVLESEATTLIGPGSRKQVIALVVQETKNKFGKAADNTANRLAVRHYILNVLEKHKMRPSHIRMVIETAVELVFIPDNSEVVAIRVKNSIAAQNQHQALRDASHGGNWLTRLLRLTTGVELTKSQA